MAWFIAFVAFASVTAGAWVLLQPRDNSVVRRLRGSREVEVASARRLEDGALRRLAWPMAVGLGRLIARVLPATLLADLNQMLARANSRLTIGEFVVAWAASIIFGAAVFQSLIRSNSQLSAAFV